MCNCNQKRASYSQETTSQRGKTKVRLVGENPISLNGNSTGRLYVFSPENPLLWVDTRDAIGMGANEELQVIY